LVTLVSITGTGFVPNQLVEIRQCRVGGDDSSCGVFAQADALADGTGAIALDFEIRRGMRIATNEFVDCLDAPGCELVSSSFTDPFLVGHTPLAFDASVPVPPPPDVTATPSAGLADHQIITITATGFAPHDDVIVGECGAGLNPFGSCTDGRFVEADDSGAVQVTLRARRFAVPGVGDCASAPGACVAYAM